MAQLWDLDEMGAMYSMAAYNFYSKMVKKPLSYGDYKKALNLTMDMERYDAYLAEGQALNIKVMDRVLNAMIRMGYEFSFQGGGQGSRSLQRIDNNKNMGKKKIANNKGRAPPNNPNRERWWFGADNIGFGSGERPNKPKGRARGGVYEPRKREQIVEEDEVIGVVAGDSGYSTVSYDLQPGVADTFPWLSQIAPLYERYKVEYMEVYYKPMVSGYSADGQTGKVVICADYDAAGSPPDTLAKAETVDPHVDCMPYQEMHLMLAPNRLTPSVGLFVRGGMVPLGTDIKTYDAGKVFIAVAGTNSTNTIGELRIRYKVRFMNPRLPESVAAPSNHIFSELYYSAATLTGGPLVVPYSSFVQNGLGLTVATGVIALPAGILRINAWFQFIHDGGTPPTVVQMFLLINGVAVQPDFKEHDTAVQGASGVIPWIGTFQEGDTVALNYSIVGGGAPTCSLKARLFISV